MESKDLRIGNWIEFSEEGLMCKVTGIDKHGVNVYIPETTEETWIEINQFSPIQLTEKMLSKCGFKKKQLTESPNEELVVFKLYKGNISFLHAINSSFSFQYGSHLSVSIRFVHELQNLYYTLTNKEMEINL